MRRYFLTFSWLLATLVAASAAHAETAGRVLVFTKTAGWRHDSIPTAVATLRRVSREVGLVADHTEDAKAFTDANLARYRVVVFASTTGDVLDAAQQQALERFVERGGGFVGVHAAADTEYDWPWYGRLVGAYFLSHPPGLQATLVQPERDGQRVGAAWPIRDELYNYRSNPRAAVRVLDTIDEARYDGGTMGKDHPISWCHAVARGRSWYTGLGHDAAVYANPNFLARLRGGLRYAAGLTADCGEPAGAATSAQGEPVALTGVHVVHVEDGRIERSRTVIVRDGRIEAIQPESQALPAGPKRRVDARGLYLIPGLWDMHVHAHRAGRERWHYPMYIAHGVVGVRDASTHLGSGMDFRTQGASAGPAPRVIWGSPALDRAPPFLSHGLAVETPEAGRQLVRLLAGLGYDFIKVYDGLSPENYHAIAEEAKRVGIPVEGHVPLTVSPTEVARAGQRTIEHLTLVLEGCIPGTLDWVKQDPSADSLSLLSDGRLAAALDRFDAAACSAQSKVLADAGVWQVPTLVQARGYFVVAHDDPADEPRLAYVPPDTRTEWFAHVREGKPEERRAGAKVFARQHQLVGELHRAGVGILAGTDASDEVWVFPGSSLHEELALLVEAGLSPLDALRAATLNPARYRARGRPVAPLIAPGGDADLVLLRENPLEAIQRTRDIRGVVAAGHWYSPEDLAAMAAGVRDAWPAK